MRRSAAVFFAIVAACLAEGASCARASAYARYGSAIQALSLAWLSAGDRHAVDMYLLFLRALHVFESGSPRSFVRVQI